MHITEVGLVIDLTLSCLLALGIRDLIWVAAARLLARRGKDAEVLL